MIVKKFFFENIFLAVFLLSQEICSLLRCCSFSKLHGKKYFFPIIFLLIFLFFFNQAQASIERKTSFDNRNQCEENKGVWREFGNGCVDECYAKFDEFGVCTYARTFGCDCGKGKCWNGDECIAVLSYKKIFDELKQRDIDAMTQAKKKRIAEAKKYQQDLIMRMIENRSALTVAKYNTDDVIVAQNNFSNNNYGEVYNKKYPQISQGKQYVTNFDERYYSGNNVDKNRLKSIQYQAPHVENVEEKNGSVGAINQAQVNSQNLGQNLGQNQGQNPLQNQGQIISNPNQNQQLIIQQPGMENQIIANDPIPASPIAQNSSTANQNSNEVKNEKPVEVFNVPMDFMKNSEKNKKSNEPQLPVIDLPK